MVDFLGKLFKKKESEDINSQELKISKLRDEILFKRKASVDDLKTLHYLITKSEHPSVWNHGLNVLSEVGRDYKGRNGGVILSASKSMLRKLKSDYAKKFS